MIVKGKVVQDGNFFYQAGNPYPVERTNRECPKCGNKLRHDHFCECIDIKTRKLQGLFQCPCGFKKIMDL